MRDFLFVIVLRRFAVQSLYIMLFANPTQKKKGKRKSIGKKFERVFCIYIYVFGFLVDPKLHNKRKWEWYCCPQHIMVPKLTINYHINHLAVEVQQA